MWATTRSVSIRAGELDGFAYWDPVLQTYAATFTVFDHDRAYPPPRRRFGRRWGEFVTVDALAGRLGATGLVVGSDSLIALDELARAVEGDGGGTELVGLVDQMGRRRLYLVPPDGSVTEIHPVIDHPDHWFHWGDASDPTVATARAIVDRTFGRPGPDELETFALTLTVEYLALVTADFSISASSLADWYLTDAALTTTLSAADRARIRRAVDLGSLTLAPAS